MSYCQWSDDDCACDVYCYADVAGGYTTHIRKARPVLDTELPPPVPFDRERAEEWLARHSKVMEWRDTAEYRPIGLPHDGETFNDPTPGECADRLEWLRGLGYNVPQYAIDALREETADYASQ